MGCFSDNVDVMNKNNRKNKNRQDNSSFTRDLRNNSKDDISKILIQNENNDNQNNLNKEEKNDETQKNNINNSINDNENNIIINGKDNEVDENNNDKLIISLNKKNNIDDSQEKENEKEKKENDNINDLKENKSLNCSKSFITNKKEENEQQNIGNNSNNDENCFDSVNKYDKNINRKKIDDNNLMVELKILLKNLEAKNANIEDIKNKINNLKEIYIEKNNDNPDIDYKDEIIKKVYEIFNIYLKFENEDDKNNNRELSLKQQEDIYNLKSLILYLYTIQKLDEFFDYLMVILINTYNYSQIEENDEIKICNYIIDFMNQEMKDKIQKLNDKYKDNSIIKFYDFSNIIMENNEKKIFMETEAIEYLLYKMKKNLIDNGIDNLMDDFDIKVFLDFYGKEKKEIKDSVAPDDNNKFNI